MYPIKRNRRLRSNESIRNLVRETIITPNDFLVPLFVVEGKGIKSEIPSMPSYFRFSLDTLETEIKLLWSLGLKSVLVFVKVADSLKDNKGAEALNSDGLMQRAVKTIKNICPEMLVMTDVALDPYSIYGHDGIVSNGIIQNDDTVEILTAMSLSHIEAGANFVAPSDMMDGRISSIREAFEDVLTGEHHPGYFLYLSVDPAEIDVNIHPTKTEIKFEDERAIYAVIRSAARHAIGQFNVAPTIDFDAEQSFSVPPLPEGQLPRAPQIKVNPNFNPFETTQSPHPRFRSDDEKYQRIQQEKYLNTAQTFEYSSEDEIKDFWNDNPATTGTNEHTNEAMVWGKHMVTLLGRKLLIINISAARYRIFYDQFLEKLRSATLPSQQLLFPEEIQVGLSDQALLQEYEGWFATAGFDLRAAKNPGEFSLVGAPMLLAPEEAVPTLEELLEQLKHLDTESIESALLKSFAQTLAKKAANSEFVKTKEALQALKEQLLSSSNPQYSPSGKKVILELAPEDLDTLL